MSVVETLSIGCPVICSNIKSLPELVENGKNGWVLETLTSHCLIEYLTDMLSGTSELSMSSYEIAKEFREKWNWDKYLQLNMETYVNVERSHGR